MDNHVDPLEVSTKFEGSRTHVEFTSEEYSDMAGVRNNISECGRTSFPFTHHWLFPIDRYTFPVKLDWPYNPFELEGGERLRVVPFGSSRRMRAVRQRPDSSFEPRLADHVSD